MSYNLCYQLMTSKYCKALSPYNIVNISKQNFHNMRAVLVNVIWTIFISYCNTSQSHSPHVDVTWSIMERTIEDGIDRASDASDGTL